MPAPFVAAGIPLLTKAIGFAKGLAGLKGATSVMAAGKLSPKLAAAASLGPAIRATVLLAVCPFPNLAAAASAFANPNALVNSGIPAKSGGITFLLPLVQAVDYSSSF